MNTGLKIFAWSFWGIIPFGSFGQLQIDDTQDLIDLIPTLQTDGMTISNITVDMPKVGGARNPVGEYTDVMNFFELTEGVILTTGSAKNAVGPNDSHNISQTNNSSDQTIPYSNELQNLVDRIDECQDLYGLDPNSVNDYIVVEFDFVTTNDWVLWNYVFASEEYPYPNAISKSDAFAMYLSGPSIVGSENIALVNGDPIAVCFLNDQVNSEFYVDNGTGDTPFVNFYHQYDGHSSLLKAKRKVTPGATYHVKIILADADWTSCDSAVLIEPGQLDELISVNDNVVKSDIKMFPNPANEKLNVVFELADKVLVRNSLGRIVDDQEVNGGSIEIDMKHYVPGIYHISVVVGEKVISQSVEVF